MPFLYVLPLLAFVLIGCYEDMECLDSNQFSSINVISRNRIDSVKYYVNSKQVCFQEDDVYEVESICYDSLRPDYLYVYPQGCLYTSQRTWGFWHHCFVGGKKGERNLNKNNIVIDIYTNSTKKKIEITEIDAGGLIVNLIPEQDTSEWFKFTENPIRPFYDEFNSPVSSERRNCVNDYCIAILPMVDNELCYDK